MVPWQGKGDGARINACIWNVYNEPDTAVRRMGRIGMTDTVPEPGKTWWHSPGNHQGRQIEKHGSCPDRTIHGLSVHSRQIRFRGGQAGVPEVQP